MSNAPLQQPTIDELRGALGRAGSALAAEPITTLAEGWDFWAFTAGDYVVRVPKGDTVDDGADATWPILERLQIEQRLLRELEPVATLPLPHPQILPNALRGGLPVTLHHRVPGVALVDLKRPLAPGFGVALGRFLRRLHAFPAERAREIGLAYDDGPAVRRSLIKAYETYVRRAFPLLGCESRTHAQRTFEAHVNDPAVFSYRPRLIHADVNDHNLLADPETGELTGVIDFGDARIGNPVEDALWACFGGFERHGIAEELPAFLHELGVEAGEVERQRAFYETWWPLDDIDHGVETGDRDLIEDATQRLYAATPRGIICNT